jgi:hypothetical protein
MPVSIVRAAGAEVDLVMDYKDSPRWGIEIARAERQAGEGLLSGF